MPSVKLTTFVPPRPSRGLMRVAEAVNRRILLSGLPLLRDLPGFQYRAWAAGVAKVRHLVWHDQDADRLKALLAPGNVTFVAANHPEAFTDWVLAREIAARFAPDMAMWLPASLVNGRLQPFWLRNNYVPQLTGPDGNPAKVHSLDWALSGKGVFLHPEAHSGWHADAIGPLYPAIAEMALRAQLALERQHAFKAARIAPLVWKLRFLRDEDDALHREVSYVEQKLELRGNNSEKLERRVLGVVEQLLEREEVRCGLLPNYRKSFVVRWEALYALVLRKLFGPDYARIGRMDPAIVVRLAQKKTEGGSLPDGPWHTSLRWLARFSPHYYAGAQLTQEQLAEILQRVRQDHCEGAWADRVNQTLPSPVGPRIAYLALAPELSLADFRRRHPEQTPDKARETLTRELRLAMQGALTTLNNRITEESGYVVYPNPFPQPGLVTREGDDPA